MLPTLVDFIVPEFVHPDLWNKRGEEALGYVDKSLVNITMFLRQKFGPITINDYHWGGAYKDSGLRMAYGSWTSAHRFGKALDLKFAKDSQPELKARMVREVFDFIMANQKMFYDMGLRRLEHPDCAPTWLHIDSLETNDCVEGEIYVFRV